MLLLSTFDPAADACANAGAERMDLIGLRDPGPGYRRGARRTWPAVRRRSGDPCHRTFRDQDVRRGGDPCAARRGWHLRARRCAPHHRRWRCAPDDRREDARAVRRRGSNCATVVPTLRCGLRRCAGRRRCVANVHCAARDHRHDGVRRSAGRRCAVNRHCVAHHLRDAGDRRAEHRCVRHHRHDGDDRRRRANRRRGADALRRAAGGDRSDVAVHARGGVLVRLPCSRSRRPSTRRRRHATRYAPCRQVPKQRRACA
jgi:hypothetical protein